MKSVICLFALVAVAVAYPAQDGAAYTNEAIRQAQTSHLIPSNAQIQNVRMQTITPIRLARFRLIPDLLLIKL